MVAVGAQTFDSVHHDADFFRCARKVFGIDTPLRFEVLGQMSKVIERDTIRRKFDHFVQSHFKGLAGLERKTVDQVHVDGLKAVGTSGVKDGFGHFERLNTVDCNLNSVIEVLNADTHTVETGFGQNFNLVDRGRTRIDFNGNFCIRRQREVRTNNVHHLENFFIVQESRRAAAEMKLNDFFVAADLSRNQFALLAQNFQIFFGATMVFGHFLIAAAEETDIRAERNMDVQR